MVEALGIGSWTAVAIALALLARWLPPWRRSSLAGVFATALLGAWAGGILATVLGFGGLAGFDPRSLTTAGLGALLGLLLLALWRTRSRPAGAGRPGAGVTAPTARPDRR